MSRCMIHLYTGNGKGKTTAALGLLLRAFGHGKRTVLVQFLKGRDTGEIKALEKLGDVTILRSTREFGFFNMETDENKKEIIKQNNMILLEAYLISEAGACDLLVLDEICAAYTNGALDTKLVDRLIKEKPFEMELVMTGREAPQIFLENADYITEFKKQKHPFDKGIAAREGIEY